ncbi:MAG: beta-mannanase [Verrucomicrobiae bacterium]|nr:beta-mannanase [Verrucomicrobiae bacterium]
MPPSLSITSPGTFSIGCNYWASHAGTAMWSDWRPDVVEEDLRELAATGIDTLRVFPLWPDFQPLNLLRIYNGIPKEICHGETPLPPTPAGRAGVSEEMMQRFEAFTAMCSRHGLKLVVSLITGWMSGRMFVPHALAHLDPLTDPRSIMWQVRFARYFVNRMKHDQAITAWELGNECNCMGSANREQAWLWTSTLAANVKNADPDRPFISGMHSLKCEGQNGAWFIKDQAELTDVLTTHPYPHFTPFCNKTPINTQASILHATAETRLCAGMGDKPAFAEELGTLGDIFGGEEEVASRLRSNLFSLWAHDCRGLYWWCAYDQTHLENAPYDWNAIERELGLFKKRGTPKKSVSALKDFRQFLGGFPHPTLPQRRIDAVCLLANDGDSWAIAYASFILAVQAGLDIEFQHVANPLKPSGAYFLPSLSSASSPTRRQWQELLDRVRAGASLYLSFNNAIISSFEEITGLHIKTREARSTPAAINFPNKDIPSLSVESPFRLNMTPSRAEILAAEPDGNPALTKAAYGKGAVYFLSVPIELALLTSPGNLHLNATNSYWNLYRALARNIGFNRVVSKQSPEIGITEHPIDKDNVIVAAINHSPESRQVSLKPLQGWRLNKTHRGKLEKSSSGELTFSIPANDAAVFELSRTGTRRLDDQ